MRIGVTGGTGFTGGALVRQLLQDGYDVVCLARDAARLPEEARANAIVGTTDQAGIAERFVEGVDSVIHVAAMFRDVGTTDEFERINVGMTKTLLDAAEKAGVKRFVYISTMGVHGSVPYVPADENAPFSPQDDYQRTKLKAEKMCRARGEEGNIEVAIVRPCAIYGPGDLRMLKMFKMIRSGTFFIAGKFDAYFHPVFIDDLVQGITLAATKPEAKGETFVIGSAKYHKLRDYVNTAADVLGAKHPWINLPWQPMMALAWVSEKLGLIFRFNPPLYRRRLKFFKHDRAFDISKARRVLGYQPQVDIEEGFRRTIDWYREENLLPPR
ncbi:NAD-dependent epimerase/dehydratase family protein [Altererythrobacter lutimaris]|uniref:NAD-dependent epimerase/dehydratase family protein n=1 Tax=Altererythrobacter lutimaris TaxID=2743979 RepID=A0A850H2J0_9SPHN|nr:NAD-dependent epimerase/dehydratase family protein [Altererythrobacter lutimaris]NVE93357.1 NAD-dependent epimerase/dehydratase family protein [Altererythrobacter lutimaris]